MLQVGQLGEYTCPICNHDLAHVKSSYLRQQHVEKCLTSTTTTTSTTQTESNEIKFDECVFCGKNLSHFKYKQKQVHLNNCLDEIKEEQVIDTEVFAGQPVSFLSTLEICPVCHEVAPFVNRGLNQKLKHTKKCAKDNRLSLTQLLQKFQWIGWGHLPIETTTTTRDNIPPLLTTNNNTIPTHRLETTLFQDETEEYDDDFSNQVIIHKTSNFMKKRNREEDKNDETLQLAIGLSKSISFKETVVKKKRNGVNPSNERDWNAANIWSAEESKRQVTCKLDEILFPDNLEMEVFKQNEREKSIGFLNKSKISNHHNKLKYTTLFYWNLASNNDQNWNDSSVFKSFFLQHHQI